MISTALFRPRMDKAVSEVATKPQTNAAREVIRVLKAIAYGRDDNGRALGGETARTMARDALFKLGIDWGHR